MGKYKWELVIILLSLFVIDRIVFLARNKTICATDPD